MIKVSFHKIIMKKSRIWPFLTPGLAECTKGLAESGLLAESTLRLAESMTQKPKIEFCRFVSVNQATI